MISEALCSRASALAGLLGLTLRPAAFQASALADLSPLAVYSSSLQTAHASPSSHPAAKPGDPSRTGPGCLFPRPSRAQVWTQRDAPGRWRDSWVLTQMPQNSAFMDCYGDCESLTAGGIRLEASSLSSLPRDRWDTRPECTGYRPSGTQRVVLGLLPVCNEIRNSHQHENQLHH